MNTLIVKRDHLSADQERSMYRLLSNQFDGVSESRFQSDLDNKNWVVLMRDPTSCRLMAFSTIALYDRRHEGRDISIVCSGDTVVDPAGWGERSFAASWMAAVEYLRRHYAKGPLYWLLITSGYRTYRYLPVLARDFYPCFRSPTPAKIRQLMDALARDRFGSNYLPDKGLVRFLQPQVLRAELKGIPASRLKEPHVAFFAARNSKHAAGDELVCLAEFSLANCTPLAYRLLARGNRELSVLETQ